MKLVTDCLKYTFTRNVLFNIQHMLYFLPIHYVHELSQATLSCIRNNRLILIVWITMRCRTACLKITLNIPIRLCYYYV